MRFKLGIGMLLAGTLVTYAQNIDLPDFERATFPAVNMNKVKLGRFLFYDPVLSGNKTVSCASCHHSKFATSDGLPLGIGDGGIGLGPDRKLDPDNLPEERVPRNSPALFNLGAAQFVTMFHDGRLEKDESRQSGIRTPLADEMVMGFDNVLAAQAMFPVLSPDEMAGHYQENDVSRAVRMGLLTGEGGAWDIIAQRVRDIDEYVALFEALGVPKDEISFVKIANAIGAFIAFEWRADNSPFDQYVFEGKPLPEQAEKGMDLFYGRADCASCHSGLFQTDHRFHAIAMPQLGPGKAARFETHARDVGRAHVTGKAEDFYRFRTPSLRNVTATAPYGHSGAYTKLKDVIRHHTDPVKYFENYERDVALPEMPHDDDWQVMDNPVERVAIIEANDLAPFELSESEIEALVAFLETLTDQQGLDGRLGTPTDVPSGLPVDQ
ncbi:cytochrome-c peroxidase [Maritalea mediterranea]|uniref:C-type cytochrome n=1 Tax=Maritalea mediterranea TaxID=2909667 RepID=A0ABS9E6I8_9HYPH|nr:cytochrome c peroxidase [Maritalea mediterranea]MCF4098483.1 c-type cytochrome [Maritalea mediterranea]